jgi:hypothetical protein
MPTGTEELDIKVYIDYAQERTNQKGPYVFATDGTHIDQSSKTNCFIDPVTLSTFGMPLPMTKEWNDKTTPTTGNYSRFQIYDFTFTGTGGAVWWNFNQYKKAGNSYIFSISDDAAIQSAPIELTNDVIRNEPLFFSYSKLEKKGSDNQVSFKLNWKNSTNSDKDIQLHFRTDGSCDVYRGYVPLSGNISTFASSAVVSGHNTKFLTEVTVGTYIYDQYGRLLGQVANIVNNFNLDLYSNAAFIVTDVLYNKKQPNIIQTYSRTESNYNTSKPVSTSTTPNDQFNDIYIIPCRGRDLLVLTSFGLNFCHSFNDLNVPNPPGNVTFLTPSEDPIITPSGKFSIEILNGKIAFQLAKLYFLSKWTAFSQTIKTPNIPPVLPTFYKDISGNATVINFDTQSTTVVGTSTSFLTELNPGDRLLAYNEDYQTIPIGIVDFITDDLSLSLVDFPQFSSEDCSGNISGDVRYTSNAKLTGTITFTLDSGIVNGTGTLFTTELELGEYLYDADGIFIGIVQAIVSDTNLALFKNTNIARTAIPYYINLNQYDFVYRNAQYERFGNANYDDTNNINMEFIVTDGVGNASPFNNENDLFKLKIKQISDDADPLSSEDWGYMFYSLDVINNLLNETTSNTEVDITNQLTQFSMQRNENGDLSIHLESRTKFLEDLGVVKPDILAGRPVRVDLVPRPPALLDGLISFFGTEIIYGEDTLFTTQVTPGDTLYANDGTAIGIVDYIVDDFELGLFSNFIGGTVEDIEYTNIATNEAFSIFEGYLSSPQIDYILGQNYDVYSNLSFSAICKKQHLNKMYFDTAPNFDNIQLPNIVVQSIFMGGSGSNDPNMTDLLASPTIESYQVPINRSNSNGQYNFGFNIGESCGGFIEKIRSDYANNFTFMHSHIWYQQELFKTNYMSYMTFKLIDLNLIPSGTPPVVLYLNEQTAESEGGIPVYESYKRTIRSMSRTFEQPEANRVAIIGIDKSTSNRITVVLDDSASQYTPALPINRPNNWLGEVTPFVYASEKLNSLQDVNQVAEQYFNRITTGRDLIEFESDILTWYDSTSKIITGDDLTGVFSLNTTVNVVGIGTLFTSELSPGDSIYLSSNGEFIGIVSTITNDTNLVLISNNIAINYAGIKGTKNIKYLNQYEMIDIGDIVTISYLDNSLENFQIIDYSFDLIKAYTDQEGINVRKAKYRAKKVTVPAIDTPVFSFNITGDVGQNQQPAYNQKIIAVDDQLLFVIEVLGTPQFTTNSFALSNQPANMTVTASNTTEAAIISFTPDNTQANQLANNIVLTCTNSNGAVITYTFSVRVYDSL